MQENFNIEINGGDMTYEEFIAWRESIDPDALGFGEVEGVDHVV